MYCTGGSCDCGESATGDDDASEGAGAEADRATEGAETGTGEGADAFFFSRSNRLCFCFRAFCFSWEGV